MISEWEIWACAQEMLRHRGADAGFYAAQRSDELMEAGDMEGAFTWRAIRRRIQDLERERLGGDLIN